MVIAFTLQETEHRVSVLAYQTRVDDLLSNFWTRPIFRIVREYPRTKIRAESSSNGSELRSAGFTPHKIRAELSSNGSSRPASDKKSELKAHQMAHAG